MCPLIPSSASIPTAASPYQRSPSREGDVRELQGLLKIVAITEPANPRPCTARAKQAASSTSSIHATSAISHPNVLQIIKSVAFVVHCTLASMDLTEGTTLDAEYPYFDERFYWAEQGAPCQSAEAPPTTVDQIASFIAGCVQRAAFSCEDLVIALVLFNRFVCFATHPIKPHAYTWKLLFLSSLLVAQKLWDDDSVGTTDFPLVWTFATQTKNPMPNGASFGSMESTMLNLLKFNVYISPTLYAEYYFELRSFYEKNFARTFPLAPMSHQLALRLQIATGTSEAALRTKMVAPASKSEQGGLKAQGRAVLS
jgi:hypothetical protein